MFVMERVIAAVVTCVVLLSGCSHTVQGGYTGTVNNKARKWADARQQCLGMKPPSSLSPSSSSSSCDLSALAPQQHREFWNALDTQELQSGSSYWVGASMSDVLQWKESKKPLIESLGCYVKAEGLRTEVKRNRNNGPERCLTQCSTNIVGLQDETCYCLKEEEITSQQQRPLDECHVMCNKELYRCGGHNSSISVYKIPDRTLYEKRGRPRAFFWQRSQNNENEFIVISNKAAKEKKQFCVSPDGDYSSVTLKEACPSGGKVVNFEEVKVGDFLSGTASLNVDWREVSFALPLEYAKKPTWLDGGVVRGARGRGGCVSVTYDGKGFSLQRQRCTIALPSICACYSQSQTTEPPTTTTTTTTPTPTTTTTTDTTTTTATETSTTTTTTTTDSTTTMTESSTTTTATPTTSETTSTTSSTTTPETSATPDSTTTTETTMTTTTMTTTTTPGGGDKTSPTPMTDGVGLEEEPEPEVKAEKNSSMLFPFSDMKDEGDAPYRAVDPTGGNSAESTAEGGEGTAAASTSIGMIVGTAVGSLALILIVVILVVVVVRRRRKESPNSSLLKNKTQKPAPSTNYPI